MTIKALAIAAAVTVSTFAFSGRADAQYRRGAMYYPSTSYYTYPSPTYSYPSTSYYSYPTTSSGVVTSNGVVLGSNGVVLGSNGVTQSSYYSPSQGYYNGNSYYNGGYYNGGYYSGGALNNNSYTTPYGAPYTGYNNIYSSTPNGLNIGTSGVYFGGRRIGR